MLSKNRILEKRCWLELYAECYRRISKCDVGGEEEGGEDTETRRGNEADDDDDKAVL